LIAFEGIRTKGLSKTYQRGKQELHALDHVSMEIGRGESVGIIGSSGSGKSTLLNLLAGLDTPTAGSVEVDGRNLTQMSRQELARYRALKVGMVFQSFNLVSHLTALQNVELGLLFIDLPRSERRRTATAMLERLGLFDRLDHRPSDLSGGEQQRVALARALVTKPEILFADEPTGNLDEQNTRDIGQFLSELNEAGLTVVLVTHDTAFAKEITGRTIRLHYGQIVGEEVSK